MWAFATLGCRDVPLLQAIASQALRTIREFESRRLAYLAWSFDLLMVHLGAQDPLCVAMEEEFPRLREDMLDLDVVDLSNAVGGGTPVAELGSRLRDLLTELARLAL